MNDENYPPAVDLLRSSSTNDVLVESCPNDSSSPPPADQLRLIKTTVINSQPQDFVVTNGQTYRVNRSPMGISLRGKRGSVSDSSCDSSPEHAKIKMLLKALDDANRKIADQSKDINTLQHNKTVYQKRINDLELKCGEAITIFPVDVPISDFKSVTLSTLSGEESKVKSADTPSRQRNKIQSALRNEKELKIRTFSPSIPHLMPHEDDLNAEKLRSCSVDSSFITPLMSNQSTPSSTGSETVNVLNSSQEISMFTADVSEEEVIDHSPIKTDPDAHLDNMLLMDNALKNTRIPSKKSALAARLGMSAKDRRSKDAQKDKSRHQNTQNNIRKLKSSPQLTNATTSSAEVGGVNEIPSYVWLPSNHDSASSMSCTLFIAHDNPQLGKTVAEAISGGMELMIESKALDNKIAFVLAKIVYSGPVEKILISKGAAAMSVASDTLPRGSQCLVCTELRAFAFELSKDCETRVQGVIAEVNMSKEKLPKKCSIDVSTEDKLRTFFRACDARVDVILSPHHAQTWYPYWEYGSVPSVEVANGTQPGKGARKMAPQFRSKGIGYLRLGDDMSRFGTSFLSCDGFESFMDEGKGGVEDKHASSSSLPKGSGGLQNGRFPGQMNRATSMPCALTGSTEEDDEHKNSFGTDIVNDQELDVAVASLQASAVKWSDRVACLQKMGDYLAKQVNMLKNTTNISGLILENTAQCLIAHILSQKNPLVLKEAIRCAGGIGSHCSVLNVFKTQATESLAKTWTELFILCVHNLRHANRGVSEAAKASLTSLLGSSAVNLMTVGTTIRDLIGGPLRPGSTTQPFMTMAPNTARVLQWLIGILEDYSRQLSRLKTYAESVSVVIFDSMVPAHQNAEKGNDSLGYSYNMADNNSIILIAQGVIPLLSHKDVSVREAAVTLSAQLFSLDILHCGKVDKFNLNTYCDNKLQVSAVVQSNSTESLPFPGDFNSLMSVLSDECKTIFSASVEKKSQIKVAQRSIEYLNKLYSNNINSNSSPESIHSSQEDSPPPPSSELKKSLSALSHKNKRPRKVRRSSSSTGSGSSGGGNESLATRCESCPDPLADQLFEVSLSLKVPPSDQESWNHFSQVRWKELLNTISTLN